jgi:hypothetical protein
MENEICFAQGRNMMIVIIYSYIIKIENNVKRQCEVLVLTVWAIGEIGHFCRELGNCRDFGFAMLPR